MNNSSFRFTVFTKPWKLDLAALGQKMAALGADGIELPVRPGYPVEPDNVSAELPKAARLLKDEFGLSIDTIAGPTDHATIAACQEAGIGIIRICPNLQKGESYPDGETRWRREWDALVPFLGEHNVAIGIQNHSGRFVPVHAMGLARLLEHYDPRHVCAVWDPAHNALEGEEPEMALDVLGTGPRLRVLNLKNGVKRRNDEGNWRTSWVGAKEGIASWPRVAVDLQKRGWTGLVCMSAEYSEPSAVDRLIAHDLAYAKSLFA